MFPKKKSRGQVAMMVPCISGELKVERANLSDIGGGKEPGMMYFPTK